MASGVFGLRKVYKKQVQNVTDNNFASWPEGATRGYYGGGYNPSLTQSNFLRIDFNTETVGFTPNILPEQMTFSGSVSNPNGTYGYLAGSQILSSCKIRRLDFSNETVSQPGYDLPQYKSKSTGLQSDSYGYFGGGYAAPNTYFSTIVKLDFSNDTTSPVSATLSQKKDQAAGSSSSLYGYIVAGYGPPPSPPPAFILYCNISRLDFSNETLNESAVGDFPFGTTLMSGTQSSQAGYFTGGTSFPYNCTIKRLDFSSETLSDPGSTLTRGTAAMATVQNNFSAYFGGGYSTPGITYRSSIYKLDFASETVSNPVNYATPPTNNLRKNSAGISGGQSVARGNGYGTYGYTIGGFGPPSLCNITRQDFSTNTFSDVGTLPTSLYGNDRSAYNNEYGYFGGGYSPSPPPAARRCTIYRFDFSNESILTLTNSLPQVADRISHTSTREVGYFGGGYSYRFSPPVPATWHSKICKLDFSSESVSTLPSSGRLSAQKGDATAVRTPEYAFFAGGYNLVGPAIYSSVDKLDFSTDVTSSYGNMTRVRYQGTSIENNTYGYFWGGYGPGAQPNFYYSDFEKLQFSNGTFTNFPNSINPPYVYNEHNSQTDSYYGYFVGGHTVPDPSPDGTHVRRLDFSSDTTSLISPPYTPRKVRKAASMSNKY